MRKTLLTLFAATLFAVSASAIPAKPRKQTVKQPDGTTLTITFKGDENYHFVSTLDGIPLVKRADGAYCYATIDANGNTTASTQLAHNADERAAGEITFVNNNAQHAAHVRQKGVQRAAQRNANRIARLQKRNNRHKVSIAPGVGGEGVGVTGSRKGLVILVNFKDVKMQSAHNNEEWSNFFNQKGYSKNGNSGSVHDYFYNQSYGQFDLTFDVVGPVTVSKNMKEYGGNNSNEEDIDPAGMVVEACKLAASKVNFADYDWDKDGEVDQVYVIYAGYGEASTDIEDTIWPHEWQIEEAGYSLTLDGVRINTYGCSSELMGDTSSKTMEGIGTACHEFSHCLGLPDIYDTTYGGGYGMQEWDVMDYGSYAADGYEPVGYNSYQRWVSGWMQPTELNSACYVKDMKALSDVPEAYIVYNEKTPSEYYLLENRQQKGGDKALPGHGLLVIHVDYNKRAWEENTLNDVKNHQRFSIIAADNKYTATSMDGDTYPGTSGNTELTDTSKPAATLFNANADGRKYMGKPITEIAESKDGLISFTFMNGESLDTPAEESLKSTIHSTTAFTAQWGAVTDAENYNLEIKELGAAKDPSEAKLIGEDFTKWGEGLKVDGSKDISSSLDEKTATPGWTGLKVYNGIGGAKLGTSKSMGYLVSPSLDADSEVLTVALTMSPFKTENAVTLTLLSANDAELSSQSITATGNMQVFHFANPVGSGVKLKITSTKRSYVNAVSIFDGDFEADDLVDVLSAQHKVKTVASRAKQIFTGITSTSLAFTDLTDGGTYMWRVQAAKGNVLSSWTPWQKVVLSGISEGIGSLQTSAEANNDIAANEMVDVYTVHGQFVGRMPYATLQSQSAFSGVYLLRTAKGKLVKCVLK
uniref:M6 family metalloprotease domain-containing protein n=1 Tax=Alloprevotella sp. TaxID=1872471 RepID=UPI003FF0BE15